MKKPLLLILALGLAQPVWGQTAVEDIIQEMGAQGFTKVKLSRTFLGRRKLFATNRQKAREVILNNRGLILRDATYPLGQQTAEADENQRGDSDNLSGGPIAGTAIGISSSISPTRGINDFGIEVSDVDGVIGLGNDATSDAPTMEGSMAGDNEGTSGVSIDATTGS